MIAVLAFTFAAFGCESPTMKERLATPTPLPVTENTLSAFERDLNSLKTANFPYIYVLRRIDGGVFDAVDTKFIRAQTLDTNRRILSDDDKAILLGSHFKFPPKSLDALKEHYDFEDHSPEQIEKDAPDTNGNIDQNQ